MDAHVAERVLMEREYISSLTRPTVCEQQTDCHCPSHTCPLDMSLISVCSFVRLKLPLLPLLALSLREGGMGGGRGDPRIHEREVGQ